jgi:alpha-ketoglutarate-dependent taurine dioxygenase
VASTGKENDKQEADMDIATGLRTHNKGWLGTELSREKLTFQLAPQHLRAIDELLQRTKASGRAFHELRRGDFRHPALDDFLAAFLHEIRDGRGIAILSGFPVNDYDLDDLKTIYWGLGTHLGTGCSQSSNGDFLGMVTDRKNARGYTSNRALDMHTDSAEIVGLLCVRASEDGGMNIFSNSLTIFDVIRDEHPEFMPVYERGFPYHRRGEEAPGAEPITPYDCPIFSMADGVLSCRYSKEGWELALREINRTYTPLERAAIDFFDQVALRDGVRFEMKLNPGEAVFQSNFEMLHGRTAFVDRGASGQERLLMRLWLVGDPPRPLRKNLLSFENKSGRQGIDKQEGRVPGQAQFTVTPKMI